MFYLGFKFLISEMGEMLINCMVEGSLKQFASC